MSLRIWLPPQFDPASGSPAAELLGARLAEFTKRRGLPIEVRIKALSGAGGMLESLSTANAAAPLALPDLVLLPRPLLEAAALKGLLYSVDGLVQPLDSGDWFEYAIELAHLQNSTYGLPFAGDALILIYRPAEIATPPRDWASLLSLTEPLIFPAGDEQALFTLAQYLASDAPIQDDEGRPMLEIEALRRVLTFFQEAERANVLPFWLTQYTTYEQAWQAYQDGSADMLIGWTSQYLSELPVDSSAMAMPTPDGKAFTLANGWVWALSNLPAKRYAASVELAEYLTDGEFLAQWTAAAGYLPPRQSALDGWSDATLKLLAARTVRSAQVMPRNDLLSVLSPALQQATIEVLKEQGDPLSAAQKALQRLTAP
jgi:ABC-type glycerol-3-phosphate transport system substrate-binding protein